MFDLREFDDPEKVYRSIIDGTPIIRNLRMLDAYINSGYEMCFLTARSCEDVVKDALGTFLKIRTTDGMLEDIGTRLNRAMSHAVNDRVKKYPGKNDAEKKANILRGLCSEYDRVVFVDDDKKNIEAARKLGLENLKVIAAWKD